MLTSQLLYDNHSGWKRVSGDEIKEPQLILLFGSGEYFLNNSYQDLKAMFSTSIIAGCSTAGTISGEIVDDITVATLITFQKSTFRVVSKGFTSAQESEQIGNALASELYEPNLQHVFVLSDGLNINGSDLADGLNNTLPENIKVTGGLAGDGTEFLNTYTIANDEPKQNSVVAIGFYGNAMRISSGCFAGWDEFGAQRFITKSKGNILYEIDGKPALQLYKSYLGEEANDLPASGLRFPISISKDGDDTPIIRTLLAIDEDTQSLTFAGDVPEDYRCHLMKSNIDKLIENAGLAAENAKMHLSDAQLCIAISCVGRRIVLSQLVEEELEAITQVLGDNTTLSGFYSYGEIAPVEGLTNCSLHNQTMTLTLLSEEV